MRSCLFLILCLCLILTATSRSGCTGRPEESRMDMTRDAAVSRMHYPFRCGRCRKCDSERS